jgi:hypothetical protein
MRVRPLVLICSTNSSPSYGVYARGPYQDPFALGFGFVFDHTAKGLRVLKDLPGTSKECNLVRGGRRRGLEARIVEDLRVC